MNTPARPVRQAPLVSVVIPVYNGAAHIAQTLDSVFAQSYRPLEVLLVDDASPDNTLAVATATGHPLRVLRQDNAGVSQARNAGAAASHGELLCFLDQDDVWHAEHLQRQVDVFLARPDCGVVVSPYQHWYPPDFDPAAAAAVAPPPADAGALEDDFSGWVYHQFMLDCWALTSATTIRRSAWDHVGGFNVAQSYGEDWDLWLRLSREVQFAKLRWPPVLYRQHAHQGSRFVRAVDHRVDLLLRAQQAHGLSSRDGRSLPASTFFSTIAKYEMEFGWHHFKLGDRRIAVRALFSAWRRAPARLNYLLRGLAAALLPQPQASQLQSRPGPRHKS
jgi:glycosyltransferase involved in cell wall biosynthesis